MGKTLERVFPIPFQNFYRVFVGVPSTGIALKVATIVRLPWRLFLGETFEKVSPHPFKAFTAF